MKVIMIVILFLILPQNPSFSQPNITITGAKDSLAVIHQIMRYLDHLDIHEPVFLKVCFSSSLPAGIEGFTHSKKMPAISNYHLIKIFIKKNLPESRQKVVLAHEMIHVKQYVKGELEVLDNRKTFWKNQQYNYKESDNVHTPWEQEAYKGDQLLAREYGEQADLPLLVSNKAP